MARPAPRPEHARMVIGIGGRRAPETLVGLLEDCHARIRSFLALCRALARAEGAEPALVREEASRAASYFGRALPLHVRDEEETLRPRLAGRAPEIDAALAEMSGQHSSHEALLSELEVLLEALRVAPERLRELAGPLEDVSAKLERELGAHLALEERVIFPALAALDGRAQLACVAELRDRRSKPFARHG